MTKETLSEKWLANLMFQATGCSDAVQVQKIMDRLEIDYPHVLIRLTNGGHQVGLRRVFGDRSFADLYFGGTKIETGVMTEGVLGEAQNGRAITALH